MKNYYHTIFLFYCRIFFAIYLLIYIFTHTHTHTHTHYIYIYIYIYMCVCVCVCVCVCAYIYIYIYIIPLVLKIRMYLRIWVHLNMYTSIHTHIPIVRQITDYAIRSQEFTHTHISIFGEYLWGVIARLRLRNKWGQFPVTLLRSLLDKCTWVEYEPLYPTPPPMG